MKELSKEEEQKLFPTKYKYKFYVGQKVITQKPQYPWHAKRKDEQVGAIATIMSIEEITFGHPGAEAYRLNLNEDIWYFEHELKSLLKEKLKLI